MITITEASEVEEIVELVRKYLDPHQPSDGSYRLNVIPEGIQRDADWYYVLVEPDRDDVRSYDYSARLAEAESDLQEKENKKILLVPVLSA